MRPGPEPEPTDPEATAVEVRRRGDGSCVVVVVGEIDLHWAPRLAAAIDDAAADGSSVEVDFSNTTFIDSSGLSALVDAYTRLGQIPEAIVLRDPSPAVTRILSLGGVENLFTVRTSDPGPD